MAERVAYKGRMPDALAALSVNDYKTLVKARQRRWLSRNSIQYKKLSDRIAARKKQGKPVRTHMREALIMPSWVGMEFDVHNGKEFVRVDIIPNMLGHRLGEFAPTTKRVQHSAPGIKATRGSKFLEKK